MTGGLLTLQFTGVDADRTFAGLIPAPHDSAIHRVDPLTQQFIRPTPLHEHARSIAATAPTTRLVLAFCSAAGLAVAVAAQLTDDNGRSPGVVVIDPFVVSDARIQAEFAQLSARLGGKTPTDVPISLTKMEAALGAHRANLVEACGGEEFADAADYLLDRYRAWLRFLTACKTASPTTTVTDVTVIGTPVDLTPLTSARVRVIDCPTAPGSPELATAVAEIVTATV